MEGTEPSQDQEWDSLEAAATVICMPVIEWSRNPCLSFPAFADHFA